MKKVIIKHMDKIIAATAIITIGYFGYKWYERNKSAKGISSGSASADPLKSEYVSEFPLRKGSRGDKVKKLQTYLNRNIKAPLQPLVVDGIFGNLTESALMQVTKSKVITQEEYNKL